MEHEVKIYFAIMGFEESPHAITEQVGIQPTKTWLKGETIQNTAIRRKNNGWELSSSVPGNSSFDAHLKAIAVTLRSKEVKVGEICRKYEGQLSCAVYISVSSENSLPAISFDHETIDLFARIGAEINCELYLVP